MNCFARNSSENATKGIFLRDILYYSKDLGISKVGSKFRIPFFLEHGYLLIM